MIGAQALKLSWLPRLRRAGVAPARARLDPASVRRVQVGCGPHNLMQGWCNVDIRDFPGIDAVMDVTKPWPWKGLDYVYGEHFLEHLELEGALAFLCHAGRALKPGGRIRLSTPSLEWVMKTHFTFTRKEPKKIVQQTLGTNRAFHGWGHHFLYSRVMLQWLLEQIGFTDIRFYDYGESEDANLRGIERHGKFTKAEGFPSVWIVEAARSEKEIAVPDSLRQHLDWNFSRYVRDGH